MSLQQEIISPVGAKNRKNHLFALLKVNKDYAPHLDEKEEFEGTKEALVEVSSGMKSDLDEVLQRPGIVEVTGIIRGRQLKFEQTRKVKLG